MSGDLMAFLAFLVVVFVFMRDNRRAALALRDEDEEYRNPGRFNANQMWYYPYYWYIPYQWMRIRYDDQNRRDPRNNQDLRDQNLRDPRNNQDPPNAGSAQPVVPPVVPAQPVVPPAVPAQPVVPPAVPAQPEIGRAHV
jgi:hypothetical protein